MSSTWQEPAKIVTQVRSEQATASPWRECTLGEVIELKRGYDLPQRKRVPGVVPLISSSGVTDYHAEAKVKGPGVVTGRYGTLGQVYFVKEDFWPLNTTLYVQDFKGNDPRFIAYFLSGLDFFAYSDKAAVPGLNRNHLHQELVVLPPILEQRRIAEILGALDDKIEMNRRTNETLEQMARELFSSWFVDFDPVRAKMDGRWRRDESPPGLSADLYDLFPDQLVPSELGEIPEGWRTGSLADVVQLLSGGTPKTSFAEYWNGNIPWYTAKDAPLLSDVFAIETERHISQSGVDNSATQILPAKTTIISARGTVGRLACLGRPMAMNQTCYGIRGVDDYPDFFTYWNARQAVGALQARTHGTIFDTITRQTFQLVDIVIPPSNLAAAFEGMVGAYMDRMLANLLDSSNVASLRDALLPRLVSGDLRA